MGQFIPFHLSTTCIRLDFFTTTPATTAMMISKIHHLAAVLFLLTLVCPTYASSKREAEDEAWKQRFKDAAAKELEAYENEHFIKWAVSQGLYNNDDVWKQIDIWAEFDPTDKGPHIELSKCPDCNGTKNVDGESCLTCDGTGVDGRTATYTAVQGKQTHRSTVRASEWFQIPTKTELSATFHFPAKPCRLGVVTQRFTKWNGYLYNGQIDGTVSRTMIAEDSYCPGLTRRFQCSVCNGEGYLGMLDCTSCGGMGRDLSKDVKAGDCVTVKIVGSKITFVHHSRSDEAVLLEEFDLPECTIALATSLVTGSQVTIVPTMTC